MLQYCVSVSCGVTNCVDCTSAIIGDPLYGDTEENVMCDACITGKYPHLTMQCDGKKKITIV